MRHHVMTSMFLGLAFAALVAGSGPLRADEPSERERAEEMARNAIERLMRALEMMIESIPQYEMPEINENGDIIIRRKRPGRDRPPRSPERPEIDQTTT